MRYIVTLTDGSRWATDFDAAIPIRNPDGDLVHSTCLMYWCRSVNQNGHTGELHGRSFGPGMRGVVSIQDSDCG